MPFRSCVVWAICLLNATIRLLDKAEHNANYEKEKEKTLNEFILSVDIFDQEQSTKGSCISGLHQSTLCDQKLVLCFRKECVLGNYLDYQNS